MLHQFSWNNNPVIPLRLIYNGWVDRLYPAISVLLGLGHLFFKYFYNVCVLIWRIPQMMNLSSYHWLYMYVRSSSLLSCMGYTWALKVVHFNHACMALPCSIQSFLAGVEALDANRLRGACISRKFANHPDARGHLTITLGRAVNARCARWLTWGMRKDVWRIQCPVVVLAWVTGITLSRTSIIHSNIMCVYCVRHCLLWSMLPLWSGHGLLACQSGYVTILLGILQYHTTIVVRLAVYENGVNYGVFPARAFFWTHSKLLT